jgi:entericidin B
MKKTVALAVLVIGFLFVAFLTGCHTVKGIGEDIGAGGHAIEKSSGK